MIILEQNSTNTISLTLSDAHDTFSSMFTTGYTMTLTNDMSNYSVSGISLTDTSSYPDYYSLFQLTITGDSSAQDLSNSIVYLSDLGYYKYEIYFYVYKIVPVAGNLIQTGKMLLDGDDIIEKTEYTKNDDDVIYVYQNK